MPNYTFLILGISIASAVACSTSPTGRKQLTMIPESQMAEMGVTAFDEMKTKIPVEKDPAQNAYVQCVSNALTKNLEYENTPKQWEVVVFREDSANAFALPGGKIGVHTGLLKVAKTPDQLAAVIGHEIGHVVAQHGNARVSETMVAQGGLQVLEGVLATKGPKYGLLMAGLGLGAQYGVLMPHGRNQESEADVIGLDILARSGFDPNGAVQLWENMSAAGGSQPPEFLSTHPSHSTRIENLKSRLPEAQKIAASAKSKPNCAR